METSELLKKVRKIEIKTKGLSNRIFSGNYHSAFKGRGMSFSEVREYAFGDDVKAIDWNVTARFNTPYIKVFEEERELTVMLLVDVSRSAFFGTVNQMKNELITEICAVLAFSVINNNDKVGVIFFSDQIDLFIPPKKGKSHVLRIIRELLEFGYGEKAEKLRQSKLTPEEEAEKQSWWQQLFGRKSKKNKAASVQDLVESGTNIEHALKYFTNIIKKRCIAFLISDFMDTGYQKSLTLASKKHDLVGVQVYDPREEKLPNVGLIRAVDAETGTAMWLDTSNSTLRQQYEQHFLRTFNDCKTAFSKSGADRITVATNQSYVKALISFFKKRGG